MVERDKLNREKSFLENKKLRNKVEKSQKKNTTESSLSMITIIITYAWRAPDVFTKGRSSTSADVPKNLTSDVFNKHLPSVSESLTEPRTTV